MPKLERLLLDDDINVELAPLLEIVGFRIEFVRDVGVDSKDDTEILKWARRHRRILVSHDRHRDKQTKVRLFTEMRSNGGRMIEISGHTGQDSLTALGKLLVHREDWRPFFDENHGRVIVSRTKVDMKTPHQLYTMKVQRELALGLDPAKTLRHRKKPERTPTKRIKIVPTEQQQLM